MNAEELAPYSLTEKEYQTACKILDRQPNHTELGMIGAMWSEHCSYKSSRVHLSRFPTTGPRVLEGPGENAGVVDIGDGLACVFKVESHNHPSFIEPYQGAATGVGGILRDVFTMGARPIANLNSLRFGVPEHSRTRHLVSGVVAGIGDYGNCMGIPTVGGEVGFHSSYNGNILVNAFTAGIVDSKKYFKASALGPGNPIFYVGSRTGRDGIHGATMASESFDTNDPDAQEKRPTVQVGDPFTEKLLLEACLELMKTDAIVGIQDMGAAGLTSSSFEMAGRGGTGVVLNLDQIPCREEGMTPYELMLSESQERMLLVARKGAESTVTEIFSKWGLQAARVGEVTEDGHVTLRWHGEEAARLPALPLAQNAPKYERPMREPANLKDLQNFSADFSEPEDLGQTLFQLLSSPNFASRRWIYEQYDQSVQTNTVQGPGGDAAVIRVKADSLENHSKGIAFSSDVNPRYCFLNPFLGGQWAVAEAARNLSCVGAESIGMTNCMNFGNPENSEIMWQFSQCVDGMSRACKELKIPVVSGNVSFYNETDGVGIFPTPTVVLIGLINDVQQTVGSGFRQKDDAIVVLGQPYAELAASEYAAFCHGQERGNPPEIDWQQERRLQELVRQAIWQNLLHSAHDLSDGGLLVALAESAFTSAKHSLGAEVFLRERQDPERCDQLWFGEAASRILVSLSPQQVKKLEQLAQELQVPLRTIGRVIPGRLSFTDRKQTTEVMLEKLYGTWNNAFGRYMQGGNFVPGELKGDVI